MHLYNNNISIYTKNVDVNLLKPGDVLAHDILLRDGATLIKANTELNCKLISKLKTLGSKVVTLDLTKVYLDGIAATQCLFSAAKAGRPVQPNDVRQIIEPIMSAFSRTQNVVSLLLQLRSGDEYTFQHTLNVGIISSILAKWLGYEDKEELLKIAMAGTLHDIGKSRVPQEILNKPGPLTREEFEVMKTHSALSYQILCESSEYDKSVRRAVLEHHERENGSGYPQGLLGHEISPYAKIVTVADIYHAMSSERIYKSRDNPLYVLDEIRKEIDSLDPAIVLTLIENMTQHLCTCKLLLSDGRSGTILTIDEQNLRYPLIKLDNSLDVLDLAENQHISIIDIVA